MNRIKSPFTNTRARLYRLKKVLKLLKPRNELTLPSLKIWGNSLKTNKKNLKVKNMKLNALKPLKMPTKVKRSWFSATRTYEAKPKPRKFWFQNENDNSTADDSPLYEPNECEKWASIHCSMILSVKQKVQDARKSRFKGFFSPLWLRQKINDVKQNNIRKMTSLSIERDERIFNGHNSHFSSVNINSPILNRMIKYSNPQIPESLIKDVLEL